MITGFDTRRALHWTLLRLAGRVPDGLVTESRRLLAQGRYEHAARIAALAAEGAGIAPHRDDLPCLRHLLRGGPPFDEPGYGDPMPRHRFFASEPCPHTRRGRLDRAVVAEAAAEPAVRGVWRTWRLPVDGDRRTAKAVFVVETDVGTDTAGLAARLQTRLAGAGEPSPQAEVYEAGDWLPAYQRAARSEGELLWSRTPDPGIRIAAPAEVLTGDATDDEDAERVEDTAERDRILAYLESGSPVLITTARMRDVIDRTRGRSVPMNFRTDGAWIWNDISSYYLRAYGLSPDAGLVAHIRRNGYRMPLVDGVAEFRAIATLYRAAEDDEDATACDRCP